MRRLGTLILIVPLLMLAACETEYEGQLEPEAVETRNALDNEYDMMQTQFEDSYADMDGRLQQYEQRMQQGSAEMQDDMNRTLMDLRMRRDSLRRQYDLMATEGAAAYERGRDAFHDEWMGLERDIDSAYLGAIETREDFQQALNTEMTEIDRELEQMEAQAGAQYQDAVRELRTERDDIAQQMQEIENASESAWMDMRTSLADEFAEFGADVRATGREMQMAGNQAASPSDMDT